MLVFESDNFGIVSEYFTVCFVEEESEQRKGILVSDQFPVFANFTGLRVGADVVVIWNTFSGCYMNRIVRPNRRYNLMTFSKINSTSKQMNTRITLGEN